jgi:hypothetical protein
MVIDNKHQHAKAMIDIVGNVCAAIDRNIKDAAQISSLMMDGWERVSVRFDDGFGVELTFNVDDEECTR